MGGVCRKQEPHLGCGELQYWSSPHDYLLALFRGWILFVFIDLCRDFRSSSAYVLSLPAPRLCCLVPCGCLGLVV